MTPEVTQAMLKEWYWGVIMAAIVLMAFAPSFLKGKCPSCKKRALRSADAEPQIKQQVLGGQSAESDARYTMFYRCDKCRARFKRFRSQPLEDASDSKYDAVFSVTA